MNQKEIAEKIGCTDKAVSHWKLGRRIPSRENARELEKLFNIPLFNWLFPDECKENPWTIVLNK